MDGDLVKVGQRKYGAASLMVNCPKCVPESMRPYIFELTNIYTKNDNRKKGNASELMRRTISEADKQGKILILTVKPDDETIDKQSLQQWYARFGFDVLQEDISMMIRAPRQ